jgi:hypothetical protein
MEPTAVYGDTKVKRFFAPVLFIPGLLTTTYAEQSTFGSDASLQALNPAVSVIIDGNYYYEDSEEGMSRMKEEMPGFGHGHSEEEHDHSHGLENGFNLRHLELQFSAEVDDWFRASAIVGVDEESAELETAEIETTGLPWGFQAKAGKFFSDFGTINAQHSHQWNFADQPLIYELALGDHGLNEKGIQLSWQAPTPVYLRFGAELLQGENEKMFEQLEADELPENNGPRLGVGWIKLAPVKADEHALQLGLFGAAGSHQEIHEEAASTNFYDGINWFAGSDVVYTYDSGKEHGQHDVTLQAEYFLRSSDLDLQGAGGTLDAVQDGYYLQGTYGFLPRWRGGLRWEQVGLMNEMQEPGDPLEKFGDSWRASAMVDFSPSKSSLLRFQINNGDYETAEGKENIWEAYVQIVVSLGSHHHSASSDCSSCPHH